MNVYIDTSAVVKMMRWEKETAALEEHINVELERETRFVSSRLMETELRRVAYRLGIDAAEVDPLVEVFDLINVTETILRRAGNLQHHLGTLGAIHLSTVLSFDGEITRVLTYDQQLSAAADHEGLVSYQV